MFALSGDESDERIKREIYGVIAEVVAGNGKPVSLPGAVQNSRGVGRDRRARRIGAPNVRKSFVANRGEIALRVIRACMSSASNARGLF